MGELRSTTPPTPTPAPVPLPPPCWHLEGTCALAAPLELGLLSAGSTSLLLYPARVPPPHLSPPLVVPSLATGSQSISLPSPLCPPAGASLAAVSLRPSAPSEVLSRACLTGEHRAGASSESGRRPRPVAMQLCLLPCPCGVFPRQPGGCGHCGGEAFPGERWGQNGQWFC